MNFYYFILLLSVSSLCLFHSLWLLFFIVKEWLVATDSVQHVLDLVKVDGERIFNNTINSSNNNQGSKNNDCDNLVNAFVMRSELFPDTK